MEKPKISWTEIQMIGECLKIITRKELKEKMFLTEKGIKFFENTMMKLWRASFEHSFYFPFSKESAKELLNNIRKGENNDGK